jgi:hypothetical protein
VYAVVTKTAKTKSPSERHHNYCNIDPKQQQQNPQILLDGIDLDPVYQNLASEHFPITKSI